MIGNLDELKFEGGYPAAETIQKLYDQLDLQRAAQAYLDFMPAMSMQAMLDAHPRDYGASETGGMIVYVEPGEGKSIAIGLTYNTESIYASLSLDLKQIGPVVIEVPPKVLGIINDGFMRYVADLGNAGLDRGQGGKYLLLPPGYDGDVPEGYFVFRSSTYRNWVMVRGFEQITGRGDTALAYYREHFKACPLGAGVYEPSVVSASFKESDTTHPRDIRYFERLDRMVQYEPGSAFTAEELGLLRALGIVKGAPFRPDERMRPHSVGRRPVGRRHGQGDPVRQPRPGGPGLPGPSLGTVFHRRVHVRARRRPAPGRPHPLPLRRHRGHSGDGGQDGRRRFAVPRDLQRRRRRLPGRRAALSPAAAGRNSREGLLVGDHLRRRDSLAAAERPAQAERQQRLRSTRWEPGRLGRHLVRPRSAKGQGEELGADGVRARASSSLSACTARWSPSSSRPGDRTTS